MVQNNPQRRVEALGPAERILETLLQHIDHMVHNRPGIVRQDRKSRTGIAWAPVTHREEEGHKVVYELMRVGKKTVQQRVGILGDDGVVRTAVGGVVGRYQRPGLIPEVAAYMYRQVAAVFKMDNEFVARWGSWAFAQEHRDLKVVLAAFLLVQNRCGDPVKDEGEVLFFDDDLREIGESMCLIRRKDNRDLNPKLLLRVGQLLELEAVAQINRELGFGRSARSAPMGRWPKAVTRWLRHRERNPKMLQGLVKAGFRRTVMRLAQKVGYKPLSPKFFEVLRWRQKQAGDGRRSMAIGVEVAAAESWQGMGEAQICQKIVDEKPRFKRLVGLLPPELGLTRAIMAAAIQAGSVSNADMIILTPTLEELGLLDVPFVAQRWTDAMEKAENQRAANIAERVRSKDVAEKLQDASDKAVQKAVAKAVRGLRVYVMVDKSGSMQGAIKRAKLCLKKFLQGFPLEQVHVSIFNTVGRLIRIPHASSAGVEKAFWGHEAGGGTNYGAGVKALAKFKPAVDEDTLFLFVGDQQAQPFAAAVRASGLNPLAFGMLHVQAPGNRYHGDCVEKTAVDLGIPCFRIDDGIFDDPYAVTRTLRNLIESTPVGAASKRRQQESLVEKILNTDLLTRPLWAAA